MIDDKNNNIEPSPDGSNGGRDPKTGRFTEGNRAGRGGNPFMAEINRARKELFESVRDGDVAEVMDAMKTKAKQGDVRAATLFMELLNLRVKIIEAKVENDGNVKLYMGVDLENV